MDRPLERTKTDNILFCMWVAMLVLANDDFVPRLSRYMPLLVPRVPGPSFPSEALLKSLVSFSKISKTKTVVLQHLQT